MSTLSTPSSGSIPLTISSTSTLSITLEPAHGWVLITTAAIALQCILVGFFVAGKTRLKVFNQEMLETNFGDDHFQSTKQSIKRGGYPDMGNGRYSAKLSYGDWLDFNKAQRVHYNFVEQVASILIFVILGGILHPIEASVIGFTFIISRICYGYYTTPEGSAHPARVVGALLGDICLLAGFGLVVYSGISVINNA